MVEAAIRRGALEASAVGFRRVSGEGVRLEALPLERHLALRGDPNDAHFASAIERVVGARLPCAVGMVAGAAPRLLALGPDEWLIVAPDEARAALLDQLGGALAGVRSALVDVSASRAVIRLRGPRARDVLAKGMTLDLHPRVFSAPCCAQTLLARMGVLLEQTDDTPSYRLYVRASLAGFLADWLIDAAEEYSGAIPARS